MTGHTWMYFQHRQRERARRCAALASLALVACMVFAALVTILQGSR